MDGIRTLARRDLERSSRFPRDGRLKYFKADLSLISIRAGSDGDPLYNVTTGTEQEILDQVQADPPGKEQDVNPSLTLVVIPTETRGPIAMPRSAFSWLVEYFKIDPYVLRLICMGSAGLVHGPTPYDGRFTFYVGTFLYYAVWSFDPSTMRVHAIFLSRDKLWSTLGLGPVQDLGSILSLYQKNLYTPVLLVFVILVHLARKLQDLLDLEIIIIKHSELTTLHGPQKSLGQMIGIDRLSAFARELENSLGHLCDQLRHYDTAVSLLELLKKGSDGLSYFQISQDMQDRFEEDLRVFDSALVVLRGHLDSAKCGIIFYRERAKNQYSVV